MEDKNIYGLGFTMEYHSMYIIYWLFVWFSKLDKSWGGPEMPSKGNIFLLQMQQYYLLKLLTFQLFTFIVWQSFNGCYTYPIDLSHSQSNKAYYFNESQKICMISKGKHLISEFNKLFPAVFSSINQMPYCFKALCNQSN